MKVSALVASGGSGLITPAHTPAFSSFSPSILYITEWNPASRLSLPPSLPPLLLPPIFPLLRTCSRLPAPPPFNICLPPPPPHPTLPWTSISSLPAPWKCHILKRRCCSNLNGRLKRHGGKIVLSLLALSLAGSHPTFLPALHFSLFAPTQIFCLCLFMKFLQFFLDFVCVGPSVATCHISITKFCYAAFYRSPGTLPDLWDLSHWCHSKESVPGSFSLSLFSLSLLLCVCLYVCVCVPSQQIYRHMHSVFISSNLMVLKMATCWQMYTAP